MFVSACTIALFIWVRIQESKMVMSHPQNEEDLLEQYSRGRRDFSGLDLSDFDLRGATLDGSNFKKTELQSVLLIAASLKDTNFRGANLKRALLCDSDVTRANFKGANLTHTNMDRANTKDAHF